MGYEREIQSLLRLLGANSSYFGFDYTVCGVVQTIYDKGKLAHITKGLYLDIAKKYHTSWNCVEKDIRKIVEIIWNYGDRELLEEIFGKKLTKRPKNTEFLGRIAEYVKVIYGEAAITGEEEL